MSAQSEADIIREKQGNPVGSVKRRQEELGELRHDLIHDTHAWNKLQIGNPWRVRVVSELQIGNPWRVRVVSDGIQSLPPQEIVYGVERVVEIKLRALTQIMKYDASRLEWLGLY